MAESQTTHNHIIRRMKTWSLFMDLFANIVLMGFYLSLYAQPGEQLYDERMYKSISKKTSNSSKHKLEFWSEEHKNTEFRLANQH